MKKMRYTVKADFYIYAENDRKAEEKAQKWARNFRNEHDNRAEVLEIHRTPFASFSSEKIYPK